MEFVWSSEAFEWSIFWAEQPADTFSDSILDLSALISEVTRVPLQNN